MIINHFYPEMHTGLTKRPALILLKGILFFCMTPLHAHAQYMCIVYAKYQKASVKALVQVNFPVYALSKQNKKTGKNG